MAIKSLIRRYKAEKLCPVLLYILTGKIQGRSYLLQCRPLQRIYYTTRIVSKLQTPGFYL